MQSRTLSLLMLSVLFAGLHARAATLTYTETATASGSIGSMAFTNATVTLSGTGNTTGIVNPSSGIYQLGVPLSLQISGIAGIDMFTDAINVVDNNNGSAAGFGDVTTNLAILFDNNAAFAIYNLGSVIGPFSGASVENYGRSFATTGGAFILNAVTSDSFQATAASSTGTTPEPSSFALLGTGIAGLAGLARRRFARA